MRREHFCGGPFNITGVSVSDNHPPKGVRVAKVQSSCHERSGLHFDLNFTLDTEAPRSGDGFHSTPRLINVEPDVKRRAPTPASDPRQLYRKSTIPYFILNLLYFKHDAFQNKIPHYTKRVPANLVNLQNIFVRFWS